jgi:hypothetical protein
MGRTLGHLVELTAKGRALITRTFREHAAAMEEAAGVLNLSVGFLSPLMLGFALNYMRVHIKAGFTNPAGIGGRLKP